MHEGIDTQIPFAGIRRNTPRSNAETGELDEMVNLRWKDNAWRPTPYLPPIVGLNIVGYSNIHIHTNDYHHVLGVKGGVLYWFGTLLYDDDKVSGETFETPKKICNANGIKSISQTGNLLSVIDSEGIKYSLFDESTDKYILFDIDYNGASDDVQLAPEGRIDLKVEGIHKKFNDTDYALRSVMVDKISMEDVKGMPLYNYKGQYLRKDAHKGLMSKATTTIEHMFDSAKANNFFSQGYFLACTALELYDGSYILASRPVLLCPPNVSRKEVYDIVNGSNKKYSVDEEDIRENKTALGISYNEGKGDSYYMAHSAYKYEKEMKGDFSYNIYDNDEVNVFNFFLSNQSGFIGATDNVQPIYVNLNLSGNEAWGGITHNKLKMRINRSYNPNFKTIIKNLCVFVTTEVDYLGFRDVEKVKFIPTSSYALRSEDYNFTNNIGKNGFGNDFCARIDRRDSKDILEDIENLSAFYKVASIPHESLIKGDWIDVPIEDGVLSTLTEQDRLQVDSYSRNSILPQVSFMYNGRLHLANYKEELFRGFPLPYFFGHQSYGQYEITETDLSKDSLFEYGFIEVTIEDANGITSKVYRSVNASKTNKRIYSLNPILSYPDTNATKMRVVLKKSTGAVFDKYFNLTKHPFLNMAYYINLNLKPIELPLNTGTSVLPTPKEYNTYKNYPNQLKVSSVDNPIFFPVSQTHKIGNTSIVGMATNTVAVSTGQQGDAPLYVFTLDGIYALFVDSSGVLAYGYARAISRDICNNAKSITPVDGGVAFSSHRGLMMIAGSEVKNLSESINGSPYYFLQGYDYNENICNCIENERIVEMKKVVTSDSFIDFLKNAQIGYNYYDKELFVCNRYIPYCYVLSNGLWTKRDKSYSSIVNDYPMCFLNDGKALHNTYVKDDVEGHESVMLITRPITYNREVFKQTYRAVLRGFFEGCAINDVEDVMLNLDEIDLKAKTERVEIIEDNMETIDIAKQIYPTQYLYLSAKQSVNVNVRTDAPNEYSFHLLYKLNKTSNMFINTSALVKPTEDSLKFNVGMYGELMLVSIGDGSSQQASEDLQGFFESYFWVGNKEFDSSLTTEELYNSPYVRKIKFALTIAKGTSSAKVVNKDIYVDSVDYQYISIINTLPQSYDILHHLPADSMVYCDFVVDDTSGDGYKFYNASDKVVKATEIYKDICDYVYGDSKGFYLTTDSVSLTDGDEVVLVVGDTETRFLYNGAVGDVAVSSLVENKDKYPKSQGLQIEDKDIYINKDVVSLNVNGQEMLFKYTGKLNSIVNSTELYDNVLRGVYKTPAEYNISSLSLVNGQKVKIRYNGSVYNIEYKGTGTIDTSDFINNLTNEVYERFEDTTMDTTYDVVAGVNYEFVIKVGDTDTTKILTCIKSGSVSVSQIINEDAVYFTAFIEFNNKLGLYIPSGSTYNIMIDGTTYEGITKTDCERLGDLLTLIQRGNYNVKSTEKSVIGLYMFGSYDCQRWGLLGGKEHTDTIQNIGLMAHRCDVKFVRFVFVGRLSRKSYLNYIETSVSNKLYQRKIR